MEGAARPVLSLILRRQHRIRPVPCRHRRTPPFRSQTCLGDFGGGGGGVRSDAERHGTAGFGWPLPCTLGVDPARLLLRRRRRHRHHHHRRRRPSLRIGGGASGPTLGGDGPVRPAARMGPRRCEGAPTTGRRLALPPSRRFGSNSRGRNRRHLSESTIRVADPSQRSESPIRGRRSEVALRSESGTLDVAARSETRGGRRSLVFESLLVTIRVTPSRETRAVDTSAWPAPAPARPGPENDDSLLASVVRVWGQSCPAWTPRHPMVGPGRAPRPTPPARSMASFKFPTRSRAAAVRLARRDGAARPGGGERCVTVDSAPTQTVTLMSGPLATVGGPAAAWADARKKTEAPPSKRLAPYRKQKNAQKTRENHRKQREKRLENQVRNAQKTCNNAQKGKDASKTRVSRSRRLVGTVQSLLPGRCR